MFQEMMPMSQGGGGSKGYKECALWSAYSGHANSQIINIDGTLQNGLNLIGEFIQTPYDTSYLYIKTATDLQGTIDVDYYVTTHSETTPTLQHGTFSANQTIVSSAWSGNIVRSVFVGVVN